MENNISHFDKVNALSAAVIGFEFEFFSGLTRGRTAEAISKLVDKKVEVIKELNGYYRTKNIENKGPNDGSYVHERKNSGFVLLLWTWLH